MDQGGPVGEVPVERGVAHPGPQGDAVQRGKHALLREGLTRRTQDRVSIAARIGPQGPRPEDELRRTFETNFFGTLRVANAFAPVLAANGGGTLLNILSAAAWSNVPTGYAASKAAMWSATNGLRLQLRAQGTHVVGLLVGMVDTPMAQRWDVPKVSAESVVAQAYDGVADGALEVLADEPTRDLRSRMGTRAEELYPWLDDQLGAFVP